MVAVVHEVISKHVSEMTWEGSCFSDEAHGKPSRHARGPDTIFWVGRSARRTFVGALSGALRVLAVRASARQGAWPLRIHLPKGIPLRRHYRISEYTWAIASSMLGLVGRTSVEIKTEFASCLLCTEIVAILVVDT